MLRSRTVPVHESGPSGPAGQAETFRRTDRPGAASKRGASRNRFKRWQFRAGPGSAVLAGQRRRHHFRAFRRAEYNFKE